MQANAVQLVADITRKVKLSVTLCGSSIQRFEERGTTRKRLAPLKPQEIGVGMSMFDTKHTDQNNTECSKTFSRIIADIPKGC